MPPPLFPPLISYPNCPLLPCGCSLKQGSNTLGNHISDHQCKLFYGLHLHPAFWGLKAACIAFLFSILSHNSLQCVAVLIWNGRMKFNSRSAFNTSQVLFRLIPWIKAFAALESVTGLKLCSTILWATLCWEHVTDPCSPSKHPTPGQMRDRNLGIPDGNLMLWVLHNTRASHIH